MQGVYKCGACDAHFRATRRQCAMCGEAAETTRETCRGCGTTLGDSSVQRCPVCGSDDVEQVTVA
ncbi:hypothetical protein OB955_18120 [Halobacteria archaeon AArc-m2/3/4]|uniref:Double zinc ribbon n=1 Tax=Natronoglomus mannanivorans TaxID=2979990 RepID=A0AAP2Z3N4_9EURY|nr:hypothetical protein [Halobacteria archaeon AArc-xg1-1]MCU4974640.1 hypothetical protein [Halobacteria archaeon AArc-m2/3/4]